MGCVGRGRGEDRVRIGDRRFACCMETETEREKKKGREAGRKRPLKTETSHDADMVCRRCSHWWSHCMGRWQPCWYTFYTQQGGTTFLRV